MNDGSDMPSEHTKISGIGWVLPSGVGAGADLLSLDATTPGEAGDGELATFDAKQYLTSVKGYLDPASGYCLAASALALGRRDAGADGGPRDDAGVSTVSNYGAPLSAFRFYELLVRKGHRFASPLVFPHGYANTAGNLVAIEHGFGGPHLVLNAGSHVREAWLFALDRLRDGSAVDMLVGGYEAVVPQAVPEGVHPLNGAVVVWLSTADSAPEIALVTPDALDAVCDGGPTDAGAVDGMLRLVRALGKQ